MYGYLGISLVLLNDKNIYIFYAFSAQKLYNFWKYHNETHGPTSNIALIYKKLNKC